MRLSNMCGRASRSARSCSACRCCPSFQLLGRIVFSTKRIGHVNSIVCLSPSPSPYAGGWAGIPGLSRLRHLHVEPYIDFDLELLTW